MFDYTSRETFEYYYFKSDLSCFLEQVMTIQNMFIKCLCAKSILDNEIIYEIIKLFSFFILSAFQNELF